MPNQKAIAVVVLVTALIVLAAIWFYPAVGVHDSFCDHYPYAVGCR